MRSFFDKSIEFLKGVGPQKAELIGKELGIFTFGDLIQHFPFRYEDRTKFFSIGELNEQMSNVQIRGHITRFDLIGNPKRPRLVGYFSDGTGTIELVWFQSIQWVKSKFPPGVEYIVFGKPARYGRKLSISHPEIEPVTEKRLSSNYLEPVYHTTEKLKKKYVDSRALSKAMKFLLVEAVNFIKENLSSEILTEFGLVDKKTALVGIHFPKDQKQLQKAQARLKFEELFYVQLRLIKLKYARTQKYKGIIYTNSQLLNLYYEKYLPFSLTNAQKRVVKEVYADFRSGKQMNRLVQGDVGSGKTMVAFLCMLIAIGNETQCAFMAPTEILADQHFKNLSKQAEHLDIRVAKLTGSTKTAERRVLHENLRDGSINILVGTHALLEDEVQFKKLGLAIVDEQHRFGVAQRAQLWKKNTETFPHVLVMTATPIPRTLAMTLYGDLDISVIDELPAGRKPINTIHMRDSHRLKLFGFLEKEINKGRQVYIVYPLIEESEKLDYKDLMDGYESIARRFPTIPMSILHGKMKPDAKDFEMKRFVKGETKILVSTTVIEVGVDVPNASVMVIENAEKFGLSQLHQLRGRVGRGSEQSHCVLMTGLKLTKEAKTRVATMVNSNDGFEIAEKDLELRGPGDLMGTQQSGALDLLVADIARDGKILKAARDTALRVLGEDPDLNTEKNRPIKNHISTLPKNVVNWSRIS